MLLANLLLQLLLLWLPLLLCVLLSALYLRCICLCASLAGTLPLLLLQHPLVIFLRKRVEDESAAQAEKQ